MAAPPAPGLEIDALGSREASKNQPTGKLVGTTKNGEPNGAENLPFHSGAIFSLQTNSYHLAHEKKGPGPRTRPTLADLPPTSEEQFTPNIMLRFAHPLEAISCS